MKKVFYPSTVILLMFISCARSLYPLTENQKDIVFKKELLGHWKDAKDNTEYIVNNTIDGSKNYKVIVIDRSSDKKGVDTSNFLVMLVNLKGHYFLDCTPDTSETVYSKISEQEHSLLLPIHLIIKVYTIQNDYFTMSVIDNDALSLLLKKREIIIKHEYINKDEILLTERPAMLQQKLIELEKFSTIYKKDSLIRIK